MSNVVSRTVEVCVFKRNKDAPRYLLLKRSENESLYPGMWQLVTGSVHDGEPAARAAMREFQEETGLTPLRWWVIPFVNSFYDASNDTVHVSPCFAIETDPEQTPLLSHEHQEYAWCVLAAAHALLVWPGQRQELQIVHEYLVGGQEASRLLSLSL
ncbi:MAG: NUDIX domain-containing protein [Ignavibacteriales bacterium]|nr:NUDIX domain-containing protein [Ignavibacteriales bacterium]